MLCGERQKAKPAAKSYAASNDTSSAKYTELSAPHRPRFLPLDKHRSIVNDAMKRNGTAWDYVVDPRMGPQYVRE